MGTMGGGMVPFLSDGKRFDPARVDLTRRIHQVVSRKRGAATIPETMHRTAQCSRRHGLRERGL